VVLLLFSFCSRSEAGLSVGNGVFDELRSKFFRAICLCNYIIICEVKVSKYNILDRRASFIEKNRNSHDCSESLFHKTSQTLYKGPFVLNSFDNNVT
jgi:hypothetical protein